MALGAIMAILFGVGCASYREPPAPHRPVTSNESRCTLRISHRGTFVDGEPMSRADAVKQCKRTRWRVRRVPAPHGLDTDDVLVGIEWETAAAGLFSSPMGFASLGTMPVTRRAPYTCIASWTGGHENKHRKKVEPIVHFLDSDLSQYRLSADRYKALRLNSERDTSALLSNQNDKASYYRNVAFRLSAAASGQLASLPFANS